MFHFPEKKKSGKIGDIRLDRPTKLFIKYLIKKINERYFENSFNKASEKEYARERASHKENDRIYMALVCAVFDNLLFYLFIFVLVAYYGFTLGGKPRSMKQQSTISETNFKIHSSLKKVLPPYILDEENNNIKIMK